MQIPILVLNYNGRDLLARCLPSLWAACERSRHAARVVVIDNSSTDESRSYLSERWPHVEVIERPNEGLVSYNSVLAQLDCPAALLVNNDVMLDANAIDALVAPLVPGLRHDPRCFMTAPRCFRPDGSYEGLKAAIDWRWGLARASCFYANHEACSEMPGLTACAGPVLAVSRERFLALGGFDPLYLPGRIEDLDLAFRGYMAGYHVRYVPRSIAWHMGAATFGREFGAAGCDDLALRNTLLFHWKNLLATRHRLRHAIGLGVRLLAEPARALRAEPQARWRFCRALFAALKLWPLLRRHKPEPTTTRRREREIEFFRRLHPGAIDRAVVAPWAVPHAWPRGHRASAAVPQERQAVPT